jgi:hypothetical protein
MSSSSNSDLIGREIVLIVSSPWDYKAPDGTNSEYARITSFDVEKNCLVAESHREIYLPRKDVRGTRLEIHMRYEAHTFDHVHAGHRVPVNVGLVDKSKPDSEVIFAFIGAVFLEGCEDGEPPPRIKGDPRGRR